MLFCGVFNSRENNVDNKHLCYIIMKLLAGILGIKGGINGRFGWCVSLENVLKLLWYSVATFSLVASPLQLTLFFTRSFCDHVDYLSAINAPVH